MEFENRLTRRSFLRFCLASASSRLVYLQTPNPPEPVVSHSNPAQKTETESSWLTPSFAMGSIISVAALAGGIIHLFIMANQRIERTRRNIDTSVSLSVNTEPVECIDKNP